ncbi:esterase [Mycolicibacterium parafortuitum]|uniref:alpha/beta hydrolase n=1 Tax=Mycolicibacterium parafortuitum TaxID=39692 RepID=UPI0032C47946
MTGPAQPRVIEAVTDAYSFATADATIEQVRDGYDRSMARGGLPAGIAAAPGEVAGVPGTWLRPTPGADTPLGPTILFLHGGGYLFGSSRSHGPLAGNLAAAASAPVFVADYRLAPEHPFPAALDDAVAVLRELTAREGAENVVIAGDSAGGGLALATLLAARERGHMLPRAAVALSPWADLALNSPSVTERADVDPLMTREQLEANATGYLGDHDRLDPLVSPVYGDLSGLPPVYLQVGTAEILHDDTLRVADAIRAGGGQVRVDLQDGMPHVHQILLWRLPEAGTAISHIGQFINDLAITTG